MDFNNLSPYIRVAWDHVIEYPFHIQERAIYDYELLFVKDGEIQVKVEDKTYHGLPGDLFLFKPMQPHSITLLKHKNLHQPHIHFDFYYQPNSPKVPVSFKPLKAMDHHEKQWFREDVVQHLAHPLPNHIRLQQPLIIEKLLFDIIDEYERKFPLYEVYAKGLFIQLWTQLLREWQWQNHEHLLSNREHLDRVKNYISHNLYKELTLDELSSVANLSKHYLSRQFKNAFGMSPIHYRDVLRLEKAKQMIQFTVMPLTEIAKTLGYTSIHAFSRAFRKREGVPPSYYRRNR